MPYPYGEDRNSAYKFGQEFAQAAGVLDKKETFIEISHFVDTVQSLILPVTYRYNIFAEGKAREQYTEFINGFRYLKNDMIKRALLFTNDRKYREAFLRGFLSVVLRKLYKEHKRSWW